jgi:hypothetical protein
LAHLDEPLAELGEYGSGMPAATDAAQERRGGIENLMDQIEISLGNGPEPVDVSEDPERGIK